MHAARKLILGMACAGLLLGVAAHQLEAAQAAPSEAPKIDEYTGLVVAEGFEVVVSECSACHSTDFILRQRGDRDYWKELFVWMQNTQGMRQFEPETEKILLDYLSTHYAPSGRASRRTPLPTEMLP